MPAFASRSHSFTRTTYSPAVTSARRASGVVLTGSNAELADAMEGAIAIGNTYTRDTLTDMLGRMRKWGSLTDKAEAFARKLIADAATPAPAGRPRPARQTVALGDFAPMIALFDRATVPGKRAPKVSLKCDAVEIELTVAGATAREPGTLNVATPGGFNNSTWFGRIKRDGAFEMSPRVETSTAVVALLADFARDPLAAMVAYGRITGNCAVCRRALSDAKSVARGIGPVCAAKFGL